MKKKTTKTQAHRIDWSSQALAGRSVQSVTATITSPAFGRNILPLISGRVTDKVVQVFEHIAEGRAHTVHVPPIVLSVGQEFFNETLDRVFNERGN